MQETKYYCPIKCSVADRELIERVPDYGNAEIRQTRHAEECGASSDGQWQEGEGTTSGLIHSHCNDAAAKRKPKGKIARLVTR